MDHIFETVPGWFKFAPAYDRALAEAADGGTFVEVGCWQGRSTAYLGVSIVNSGKHISLHCVDRWQDPTVPSLREVFESNLARVVSAGLDLTLHQTDSHLAAAAFADRSLDFVWLDAGHRFEEVRGDLLAWLPKLRFGALIGGDDWNFLGVSAAVREILGNDFELGSADHWPWWWHRRKPLQKHVRTRTGQ
jgi:hypothetical protein